MRPTKTKFSKNPNPLVGKLLKLTFKYEKAPNKNIAEQVAIKIRINVVNV